MKIKEILADVFLLQFSQSEVVDGNAVKKKPTKGSPSKTAAVFVGWKSCNLRAGRRPWQRAPLLRVEQVQVVKMLRSLAHHHC